MFHDINGTKEYEQLLEMVQTYDKTKEDYETARASIEEMYAQVYDKDDKNFSRLVDEEAVASILGNKLGTQEFVSSLVYEKPTVARRIYNWIVDKLNLINKKKGYNNEKLFWTDVKNKFDNAYGQEYKGTDGEARYAITKTLQGNDVVVITDNILNKKPAGQKTHDFIADVIADSIGENASIIESGQKVYIGKDLPDEYTQSEYTKFLLRKRKNILNAKNKASGNLHEMIEIATDREWDKNTKSKHAVDAKYGFYKYLTKFAVPVYDTNKNIADYNIYDAQLVIRNDADGKKYLYDLQSIKKMYQALCRDVGKPTPTI